MTFTREFPIRRIIRQVKKTWAEMNYAHVARLEFGPGSPPGTRAQLRMSEGIASASLLGMHRLTRPANSQQ